MQEGESHDPDASGYRSPASPSNHNAASSGFQQGAKLREKLQKLAKWRIDQSSIEFPKDAPEFRGGNATVVKATLASPSGGKDQKDRSDPTKRQSLDSNGAETGTSQPLKIVAVKRMNISGDRARVLGLTLREAEFLVGLSHTNVIELEGFVEDLSEDIIWLVFPWEDNGTLRDFIASGEWEIPERISLLNDVAGGVAYLHSRQPTIRHGDLKSINILVNSKCRAVITDFGSARRLTIRDADQETKQPDNRPQAALLLEATFCSSTNTMSITLTGDKYTLRWAPPEVLREEEACLGSDIWALGWVAYEVMTKSIPFQDVAKDALVIKRVIQGDLPSITNDARMSLIRALCSLMLACWSIDLTQRPTAEDCRKSFRWMANTAATKVHPPALLKQLGDMYTRQGGYAHALDMYNNALRGYRDIGDRQGEGDALFHLAEAHRALAEYSQAAKFHSEALQIFTDIGNSQGRAKVLGGLAGVHRLEGRYSEAATLYSDALQFLTSFRNRDGRARALFGLAEVHRAEKEYSQALTLYSEALQIRTDLGDRRGRAESLFGLAEVYRLRNEYSKAIKLNSEALKICTDLGDRYGRACALLNLADVDRDQGKYSDAVGPYTEAAEIFQQIGDNQNSAYASGQASQARRLSKPEEAT